MSASERRARKRFVATGLTIGVQPLSFWGFKKKEFTAQTLNFSLGGVAFTSSQKLKLGQAMLLCVENSNHRLQEIPALVMRMEIRPDGYFYALKFNLGYLSDSARKAAYNALQLIEFYLKSPPQAA